MLKTKKIAVLTSGGDSPGMNATIYGFVTEAINLGYEPYVVHEGYEGLIDGLITPITYTEAKKYVHKSGSFIGSSRSLRFKNDLLMRQKAVANLEQHGISALLVVGGDGSYKGAEALSHLGFPVLTAPGTVDNDVASSVVTIGFYSAAEQIFTALKNLRNTADTHKSIFLVEAMGRHCVDLSVFSGIAGLVDAIVTAQNIFELADFLQTIKAAEARGQRGVLFLITEKIYGHQFGYNLATLDAIAQQIETMTKKTTRVNILGYLQRGATPTFHEVLLGIGFGKKAARLFSRNIHGLAIGSNGWTFYETLLVQANKLTPLDRKSLITWNNELVFINETLTTNKKGQKND